MGPLRAFLSARSWLVVAVLVAALGLRVMLPAGTMPVFEKQRIAVLVCHGAGGSAASVELDLPMKPKSESAAERCAFADLSVPPLGGVDPFLLSLALAFVLALWLTFSRPLPARTIAHLRPPLRGPPIPA
jgi:hypothetical protein